jgi:hypothetical protein
LANYTSTQDLKKGALAAAGELVDGTSEYEAKVLEYLNKWHLDIIGGKNDLNVPCSQPWVWAKAANPGVLILKAPYETGTIALTNGSTVATLSSAPSVGLGSFAGRTLQVAGRPELFRIATHVAGTTAMTLDAAYTDEDGSGLAYSLHKLEYTLTTGLMRLIGPMHSQRAQIEGGKGEIEMIQKDRFDRDFPSYRILSGVPTNFTQTSEVEGLVTVRFNSSVTQDTRVEYDYIPIPSDLSDSSTNYPLIPREHRIVLQHGATMNLMLDKNDTRASSYADMVKGAIMALVGTVKAEKQITNTNYGKLIARPEQFTNLRNRKTQETSG